MKKLISFILFIFVLFSGIAPVYADSPEEPEVNALGAVLMDAETGRILWGKNEKQPLAMASTTKIMTAIIALEKGNLNDTVTISKKAAAAPKVHMHLVAGEEIKLEFLLYALMLESFNDSAVAIAEHVAGSTEEFCRLMTDKAGELGALDTVFETPNGLDQGEHHSTAYDLALIARYALENEKFMEIINTPSITVSSNKRSYTLNNKDRLLREYQGANGIKTGFTGKAGHCFVGAAKRDGMQLISVVLGSGWGNKGREQKWTDTKALLNYGFTTFKYKDIITQGNTAESVSIDRSKTPEVKLAYKESLMLPLSDDEAKMIRVEISAPDMIMAPVKEGDTLGTARIFIGSTLCKEIPLLAEASAERHDLKTSMEKIIDEWLELGTNQDIDLILPEF